MRARWPQRLKRRQKAHLGDDSDSPLITATFVRARYSGNFSRLSLSFSLSRDLRGIVGATSKRLIDSQVGLNLGSIDPGLMKLNVNEGGY